MIRFIIAATFLGLFLLVSYILFFIEWIVGKISKKAKDYSSLRIVQWGFSVILKLSGLKLTIKGKENEQRPRKSFKRYNTIHIARNRSDCKSFLPRHFGVATVLAYRRTACKFRAQPFTGNRRRNPQGTRTQRPYTAQEQLRQSRLEHKVVLIFAKRLTRDW